MSYYHIQQALTQAVQGVDTNTPTSWPDQPLTDKPEGLSRKVSFLSAGTRPVTLGDMGEDNHEGILQIDFDTPVGSGAGVGLQEIDRYKEVFKAGANFAANGQHVIIRGSEPLGGREVGSSYRQSLSIRYYARINRS